MDIVNVESMPFVSILLTNAKHYCPDWARWILVQFGRDFVADALFRLHVGG